MKHAARLAAIFIPLFCFYLWSSPSAVLASPSANECFKNPELQGCPSSETTKQSSNPVEEGEKAEVKDTNPSLFWNIIKLVFALMFILALIYGLLKFFNKRNRVFTKNRTMENLGGMNLAPNRSVQAVRIGKQVFILGVGESIDLITEVTDDETKNSLLKQEEQIQDDLVINKWMNLMKKREEKSTQTKQFQELFKGQLNEMKQNRKQLMNTREDQNDE